MQELVKVLPLAIITLLLPCRANAQFRPSSPEHIARPTTVQPTPTNTSVPSATSTPEAPPTAPVTATPTPTATATCQYYSVDFSSGYRDQGAATIIDQRRARDLACFESVVNSAFSLSSALGTRAWGRYTNNGKVYSAYDGKQTHVAGGVFTSLLWEALKRQSGFAAQLDFSHTYSSNALSAANNAARSAISCTGGYGDVIPKSGRGTTNGFWQIGGSFNGIWENVASGCRSGSIYLDSNCNLVPKAAVDVEKLCGNVTYHSEISTPISLVWSEAYREMAATVVHFKLNPFSSQELWGWRGSGALPLLVSDPRHLGEITSATQLFGHWAFGGRDAVDPSGDETKPSPWEDGYQALASLDFNGDSKLSGVELTNLALWFDQNQDGVSQPGEVKRLFEVGITTLFTTADGTENGAPTASVGYIRDVEGRDVIGRSIDWSEKGISEAAMMNPGGIDSQVPVVAAALTPSPGANGQGLQGVWRWAFDEASGGSGLLIFDSINGVPVGAVVNPIGIANVTGVASQVVFSNFIPSVETASDGTLTTKFTVRSPGGATMENSVRLEKGGNLLLGKTVVTGSSVTATGSYEYSWRAAPYVPGGGTFH